MQMRPDRNFDPWVWVSFGGFVTSGVISRQDPENEALPVSLFEESAADRAHDAPAAPRQQVHPFRGQPAAELRTPALV